MIRPPNARAVLGFLLSTLLCAAAADAQASTSASFLLSQDTGGGAGATSTSASFHLDGTLAQESVVGEASSASFRLQSGFWTSASTSFALTVLATGSGSGTLAGEGITCTASAATTAGDCGETVPHGTTLTLTAAPDPSSTFDGWSGCDATSTTVLPSDTCSVQMLADGAVTAAFTALGSLGDRVWSDFDGDGVQDGGEPGIDGVTVELAGPSGPQSAVTSGGGLYAFTDLASGAYTVSVDPATLPSGVVASFDFDGTTTIHTAEVALAEGEHRDGVDFGYQPLVDLAIAKSDGVPTAEAGGTVTYTIVASNAGPHAASGIVTDTFPAACGSVEYTSVAAGGATGNTIGPMDGDIGDTLDLPAGGSVTYTATCTVDAAASGSLVNTATIADAAGVPDTNPANDSATDSDTIVHPGALFTVTPCRLLDTRQGGQGPALSSGLPRMLTVPPGCGIPVTAKALAFNITVVGASGGGHVTVYPADIAPPGTSTINFAAGQTRAGNAVVALAGDGSGQLAFGAVIAGGGTVDLIVDVAGYFE